MLDFRTAELAIQPAQPLFLSNTSAEIYQTVGTPIGLLDVQVEKPRNLKF